MAETLHFLVPGSLDQLTGGYLYDRHIVDGLRARGRDVQVYELPGRFPLVDQTALAAATQTIAALPDQAQVLVDGLALPACVDALQAQARRLRFIVLIHHPLAAETGLPPAAQETLRQVEHTALRLARRVIVTSPFTAKALGAYHVAAERIGVVVPGTEPATLSQGSGGDALTLLCVATVIPRKGHTVLVEALAALQDLDWHLVCIGSLHRHPATAQSVHDLLVRRQLEARITLCGEQPQDAVEAAYQRADVFVLPSHYEGYGMVLSEALAHGLPIISTTAGAIPDTVPSTAGLLVPAGDVAALALALRQIISQSRLRAELTSGARRVRDHLPQWSQAVAGFAAELDRVVEENKGA